MPCVGIIRQRIRLARETITVSHAQIIRVDHQHLVLERVSQKERVVSANDYPEKRSRQLLLLNHPLIVYHRNSSVNVGHICFPIYHRHLSRVWVREDIRPQAKVVQRDGGHAIAAEIRHAKIFPTDGHTPRQMPHRYTLHETQCVCVEHSHRIGISLCHENLPARNSYTVGMTLR